MTGWITLLLSLESRDPSSLAEQSLIAPVGDKPCFVVRSGALAHLAHFLGEGVGPGEAPGEVARGARLEEQAVAAGLDDLGQAAHPARDHRQAVRESLDQRA